MKNSIIFFRYIKLDIKQNWKIGFAYDKMSVEKLDVFVFLQNLVGFVKKNISFSWNVPFR